MKWFSKHTCILFATSFDFTRHLMLSNNYVAAFSLRPYSKYSNDIFRYKSKMRRKFKEENNYINHVQDHHCIPKEWKNHELLEKVDFDINSSKNLIIMPNAVGKKNLNLHPDVLIHQGGHHKYNQYVKVHMDNINTKYDDECHYEFWLFLNHLKSNMKFNEENIPWK